MTNIQYPTCDEQAMPFAEMKPFAYHWMSLETDAVYPYWHDRLSLSKPDGSGPEVSEYIKDVRPLFLETTINRDRDMLNNEREIIAIEARRYASHYPSGSDGRNTFVLLAEWVEGRMLSTCADGSRAGA